MSGLLSRGAAFALVLLGSLLYFAVAVIEWRLGSAYHAGLVLALAALFVFTGRGGRVTVGTALMLGAVLIYGVFRAAVGLTLLGAVTGEGQEVKSALGWLLLGFLSYGWWL